MKVLLVHSPGPRRVEEIPLDLPPGSTLAEALEASGVTLAIDAPVGIWGRKQGRDAVLREGDRIEVYRVLRVDPKVARRERFAGQGSRGAGLFSKKRPGAKAGY
ncbi:RnfH family protein [Hydrogenophaga sp. 5NK40-0174]|uniref:RnfH family protein n=1 Tax=Hydrogenophaga sp. 5NK40-0174 TaxID=3127649 RepID=UPI003106D412